MSDSTQDIKWEQRWHPLREEWVVIAGHRQNRPWLGEELDGSEDETPAYIDDCYLCPGNKRVSGASNDPYTGVFVFDNDHPCVGPDAPMEIQQPAGIYKNKPANGIARVVCYSPKHNTTLAELTVGEVDDLLSVWQDQYTELSQRDDINNILIFENKGEAVGVSNPHPHCQIYATNFVFKTMEVELSASNAYFQENKSYLFEDIIRSEQEDARRILAENDHAIAFVPYFARYPYETFVAPKRRCANITGLNEEERRAFAEIQREILIRFDNLWTMPFPYLQVLHNAPCDGQAHENFHFYIQFLPPLRKPNLLKYLAGPEIGGGNFLNDTLPEDKAAELQAVSHIHYKDKEHSHA